MSFCYSFDFSYLSLSLFYKSYLARYGALSEDVYCLNLQNDTFRCVVNDDFSMLWHRRLGHISQQRIKQLVNDGVLSTLDFTDYKICIDYTKGK